MRATFPISRRVLWLGLVCGLLTPVELLVPAGLFGQQAEPQRANSQQTKSRQNGSPRVEARQVGSAPGDSEKSDAEADDTPSAARRPSLVVTPEREAAALTFVGQHHPELEELLRSLERSRPRVYARAIAELFRTSERLAQFQERQPDRYELELEAWKAQSRVQLLAARWSMSEDPQLRPKLREALARQLEARRRLLELERRRVQTRLERLEEQIQTLDSRQEEYIERQLKQLGRRTRPIRENAPRGPHANPPAGPKAPAPGGKSSPQDRRPAAEGGAANVPQPRP